MTKNKMTFGIKNFFYLTLLLAILGSCNLFVQETVARLSFAVPVSRDAYQTVSVWKISALGPGQVTEEKTLLAGERSVQFDALIPGEWTFTVQALASDASTILFSGSASTQLVAGSNPGLAINISGQITYVLTLHGNGASLENDALDRLIGAEASLPVPQRKGYSFAGWYSTEDFTDDAWTLESRVFASGSLYARWTAAQFTVSFDLQGGFPADGVEAPASRVLDFGAEYGELPSSLERSGYTFAGWWTSASPSETEEGQRIEATSVVDLEADQVLYARWTPNTYTISYDVQGGTSVSPSSKTVTFGAAYGSLPTTSKAGFYFRGWWTGILGTGTRANESDLVALASDHTLYANWSNIPLVSVNFDKGHNDASGWSGSTSSLSIPENGSDTIPTSGFTRLGYTFAGWALSQGGALAYSAGATISVFTSDITLYARWTGNTYTVSFDADGGSATVPVSKDITFGQTFGTLPTTTQPGYTFQGWYTEIDGGGQLVTAASVYADTSLSVLYAYWIALPVYSITFDGNGAGSGTMAVQTIQQGLANPLSNCNFTRTGYNFDGWSTADDATVEYTNGAMYTMGSGDVVLWAVWSAYSYTLFYDGNGNTGGAVPNNINVPYESTTPAAGPGTMVRTGYSFGGWKISSIGSSADYQVSDPITVDFGLTVFAHWIPSTYTVSFNEDGGSVPVPTSKSVTYASTYGTLPVVTKSGYTFAGWRTATAGAGSLVQASTTVTNPSNHTLYAHWINTFTFTNALQTGPNGPNQTQINTAYAGTSLDGAVTVTGTGIQQWTVPASGQYRIEVYGAKGADSASRTGGLGAVMKGDFTLTANEVLYVLAGQMGGGNGDLTSGGGGGSFVVRTPYNTLGSVLIAAGGGGGATSTVADVASRHGTISTTAQNGYQTPGVNDTQFGIGGSAGNGATNNSTDPHAGNGGGFLTAGASSSMGSGTSFILGGAGGGATGGFGGGGAGGSSGGGGGGGYSGGGGTYHNPTAGGGGGSYNGGTSQDNTGAANNGHGYVIITYLGP